MFSAVIALKTNASLDADLGLQALRGGSWKSGADGICIVRMRLHEHHWLARRAGLATVQLSLE